jgi:MoaA/NifB/PqqE/SkfB family radical SAM enzyme
MLPFYASELVNLNVTHVTITINAVDPEIGAKIYKNINYFGKTYSGKAGADILIRNQLTGLKFLSDKGVMCKVNIVDIAGINENHIYDVVKTVKECGASIANIMQMIPVAGTPFEHFPLVPMPEIAKKRTECQEILPQMFHCKQCRADAAGLLDEDISLFFQNTKTNLNQNSAVADVKNTIGAQNKILYAAASKSGFVIDLHFGMASEFYIYEHNLETGKFSMVERRKVEKYCAGKTNCGDKEDKIGQILSAIKDCKAVLCNRVGDAPAKRLNAAGIEIYELYDTIEEGLKKILNKDTLEKNDIRQVV